MCFSVSPVTRVASLLFFAAAEQGIDLKTIGEYDAELLRTLRNRERDIHGNPSERKTYRLSGNLSDLRYELNLYSKYFQVDSGFFDGYGRCYKKEDYNLDSFFQLKEDHCYVIEAAKEVAHSCLDHNELEFA